MDESFGAPGLLRRLGAIFYDLVLLLALLMLATAALMPLTKGAIEPGRLWFTAYLMLVICTYFGFFWLKRGQTLGMQTWKIRIQRADGAPLKPVDVVQRLFFAGLTLLPLGAGLWWMVFDRDRLAVYDRLSATRLIRIQRIANARD